MPRRSSIGSGGGRAQLAEPCRHLLVDLVRRQCSGQERLRLRRAQHRRARPTRSPPRPVRTDRCRARTTRLAITIALRPPIFENTCGPLAAGMSTATTSSSGASASASGRAGSRRSRSSAGPAATPPRRRRRPPPAAAERRRPATRSRGCRRPCRGCGSAASRGARGVREPRQLAGQLRDQPRVRHARAEPHCAVAPLPVEQLGHAGQVDHPRRPLPAAVDGHHQVGAARDRDGVGVPARRPSASSSDRGCSTPLTRCRLEDGADGLDRVGLVRPLVGPVALHAGEPQRHAAGVAGARLDAVERDLDDQLGPHVDDVPVAPGLAREQLLGLPCEHSSVSPLNVLPSITNPPAAHRGRPGGGSRAARGAGRCPTPRPARRGRACARA